MVPLWFQVSIILSDVNDNAPKFESHNQITVPEDAPAGSPVATIVASDQDVVDNSAVQYSIISGPPGLFTLGSLDGVLRLEQEIDREVVDKYTLVIKATDAGSSPLSASMELTVIVGDVNDNDPVFESRTYSTNTNENTKVGTSLLTVGARDADSGLNADIRYMIEETEESWDFAVDSHTGDVTVYKTLDYETRQQYEITVLAQDLGQPSRTNTATIIIVVNDINDCAPVFSDAPYKAFVRENIQSLPVHVFQLSAKDDDSEPYSALTYNIRDGNRDLFTMDRQTGVITALQTLDREQTAEYTLVVMVTDSGEWYSYGCLRVSLV